MAKKGENKTKETKESSPQKVTLDKADHSTTQVKTKGGQMTDQMIAGGETILSDTVLETIAGIATREVEGVYLVGKGALRHALGKVVGTADTTQGVRAEVGKKEVAVDLDMVVVYGFNIRDVAAQVRALISERITQMTGLSVKEININVHDIHYSAPRPEKRSMSNRPNESSS